MRPTMHKNTGRLNTVWSLFGGLALLGAAGCADAGHDAELGETDPVDKSGFSSKVILDWSLTTATAINAFDGNADAVLGTRTLSMVHLAMHDAVNAVNRIYEPYSFTNRDSTAHPVAAAAAAAHRVLVNTFPAQAATFDAKLAASLADVPNGLAEDRGRALGDQVANHFIQLRQNDGFGAVVDYTPDNDPGDFQFVPPFEGFIYHPEWRFVRVWGLDSVSQFRSAPPPSLTSSQYATDYNEVKRAGILNGSTRTQAETDYAQFWYEDSDIGWNRIARDVVSRRGLSLHSAARLFALMNVAMTDGYIAGWESKFHYDRWRPITAIRAGQTDGNGATAPDATWEPLMPTVPVQDYPSTHSVLGEAAATVLARLLGDRQTFTFTSSTAPNPLVDTRTFSRFSTAAIENADSRVKAGIHFRHSTNAGLEMGDDIGNFMVDNLLRPY